MTKRGNGRGNVDVGGWDGGAEKGDWMAEIEAEKKLNVGPRVR